MKTYNDFFDFLADFGKSMMMMMVNSVDPNLLMKFPQLTKLSQILAVENILVCSSQIQGPFDHSTKQEIKIKKCNRK